jgi:uncharacterized cysteine cluster protein YcgN (CxxCxxCC family)
MTTKISSKSLRPKFWEKIPMVKMTDTEWEALCDGCGRCCLNKLEDPDTGHVALTRIVCRLLDNETCQCSQYVIRQEFVPECIRMTADTIAQHAYWLPNTCAYKLLHEGGTIPKWHPLLTGTAQSVHDAGISVQGWTIPEFEVPEEEWEDHIIED